MEYLRSVTAPSEIYLSLYYVHVVNFCQHRSFGNGTYEGDSSRFFPLVLFVLQLLLPLVLMLPLFVPLYAILNICADFCVFSSSSSYIYFAMCFFLLLHLFCLIPKTKSHVKHEFCFSIFTFILIQKQIQMFVLCFVACSHFFRFMSSSASFAVTFKFVFEN